MYHHVHHLVADESSSVMIGEEKNYVSLEHNNGFGQKHTIHNCILQIFFHVSIFFEILEYSKIHEPSLGLVYKLKKKIEVCSNFNKL